MSRATGSGSRARSREIGYAQAMREIGVLLRSESEKWQNSAEQQIVPFAGAALKVAASSLQEIADYALGAWQLHLDDRGDFARDIEHCNWLEDQRYRAPGPRELPGSS